MAAARASQRMSGADLQETAGRIASIQQALYFAQQFLIAAAGRFQKRAALAGGPFFRQLIEFLEPLPIRHDLQLSWRYSQALANCHSRFTDTAEVPITSAVSSTVKPPKKR